MAIHKTTPTLGRVGVGLGKISSLFEQEHFLGFGCFPSGQAVQVHARRIGITVPRNHVGSGRLVGIHQHYHPLSQDIEDIQGDMRGLRQRVGDSRYRVKGVWVVLGEHGSTGE